MVSLPTLLFSSLVSIHFSLRLSPVWNQWIKLVELDPCSLPESPILRSCVSLLRISSKIYETTDHCFLNTLDAQRKVLVLCVVSNSGLHGLVSSECSTTNFHFQVVADNQLSHSPIYTCTQLLWMSNTPLCSFEKRYNSQKVSNKSCRPHNYTLYTIPIDFSCSLELQSNNLM